MFCQKEEFNHVLGNNKGARDHLVSWLLFTLNVTLSESNNVLFRQETSVFRF